MLNIYISHSAYLNGICKGSNPELLRLVETPYFCLKAAEESLVSKLKEEGSLESVFAQEHDYNFSPGVGLAHNICDEDSNPKRIRRTGLSSSLFILHGISNNTVRHIREKYGVLCLQDNKLQRSDLPEDISVTAMRGEEMSWEKVLGNIKGLPINSMVFSDHYITSKVDGERSFRNIRDILNSLFYGQHYEFPIQVLLILEENEDCIKEAKDFYKNVFLPIENKDLYFNLEVILCPKGTDLFKDTHNRFLITNYSLVKVPYTFNAFNHEGKSRALQTFDSYSGFGTREDHEKYRLQLINDIRESINKGSEVYSCMKISKKQGDIIAENISISKLVNRQIVDIQDGDNCYYLSIPNDNDWHSAEIKGPEKFISKNYHLCFVSARKQDIESARDKIITLFDSGIDPSKLAGDPSKKYYKIYVTYPSDLNVIRVKEENGSTLMDQLQYKNNHFCDEDYAYSIANQICDILGLKHIHN